MVKGYGLTEASPEVCNYPRGAVRPGTVGVPLPGTELRLAQTIAQPSDPTHPVLNGAGERMSSDRWRPVAYYLGGAVLLGFYGGQVCSFLEGLGAEHVALMLSVAFGIALAVRGVLERSLIDTAEPAARGRRQLVLEMSVFVATGVLITAWETAFHEFPLASGGKMTLGCATIGIFAAIDMALCRERRTARELAERGELLSLADARTSVTVKFAVPALVVITLLAADLFLLVNKDLDWIVMAGQERLADARMAVITEIGFVVGVMLLLTVNVVLSFARNLRVFLDNERIVLERVSEGDLERYVTVLSDDEFGDIAVHTNRMIDGLRERRRIKSIFGKMVSPKIASRILESDEGLRPSGSRRRVAIMFSDVRNYTSRTENSRPEDVVSDLNAYFQKMVEIVHAEGGVVDKFIGDGMMAAFGVDDCAGAADQAARAALAMQTAVVELAPQLTAPMEIGVGVHIGDVIAGSIGSTERLEYTFIGDTVNTAARLESLTKKVGAFVLVSDDLHESLEDESIVARFENLGAHSVKGKAEPVPVWGVPLAAQPGSALGVELRAHPPAERCPEE